MATSLRAVSTLLLLLSIGVVASLLLGHGPLSFPATFSIQAATIVTLWLLLRRRRRGPGVTPTRSIPAVLKTALPLIAAAGLTLTVMEVAALLSEKTPAGDGVSSVRWSRTETACRVTYNGDLQLVKPLATCTDLDRHIGLAFGGGWILTSAIALWLAFSRPDPAVPGGNR